MSFASASIRYRPLRIGFLVREGSIEDLVKAAGINSVLWGGIFNPLIPIRTEGDNSFAEQLVEFFSVDILCGLNSASEISDFRGKYPFMQDPRQYADKIFFQEAVSKKLVPGVLDIENLVRLYWYEKFKAKSSDFKSDFLHAEWAIDDPLAKVLALQYGFFPDMNFRCDYRKAFTIGLRAQEIKIDPADNLVATAGRRGPLEATRCELREYRPVRHFGSDGLYIGDSARFDDLLYFWNVRATGADVIFLAKDYLERMMPVAREHLDYLDGLPSQFPGTLNRLTFYHRIDDLEIMKTMTSELAGKMTFRRGLDRGSWSGSKLQPGCPSFRSQGISLHIDKADSGYGIHVNLPPMNFLGVDSDGAEIERQQLVVSIDYYGSEYNHPGYTLKLPRLTQLAEFYSNQVSWEPWPLRVEHGSLSKIICPRDHSITLHPISTQVLVEKLFEAAGIVPKMSRAGLMASKIIEKMSGLEGARVLKVKGVRMLLERGTPEASVTRGEATKTIFDNDFKKHEGLFIEEREESRLTADAVFNYLLKENYFRAGLELVCEHCKLVSWLSLKNIDDRWTCEYCGGSGQTGCQLKSRGDWKFRKSGLFSKGNHQEGAIPVLLTLLALKRVCDNNDFLYSASLELQGDGINCETDLVFVRTISFEGIEIAVGECKSVGGIITRDDCDKLKAVSKKLAGLKSGTKAYTIFSKAADVFSPEEILLFEEFSKDINLILFTNRELEPYHPYWLTGEGENDVPENYPHSLADICKNSHARYLKAQGIHP